MLVGAADAARAFGKLAVWRGQRRGSPRRADGFSAFPRSGPPPRFSDYADYAEVVGQLERTGCIADYTHIWWDIRLHPRSGTIEILICDAVTRVEDAVAIARLPGARQGLLRAPRAGERDPVLPPHPHDREQVAGGAYGLEAPVMDLATDAEPRPVAQLDPPHAPRPRAACARARRRARAGRDRSILGRGNGAEGQLRVLNANRDIVEVVREWRWRPRSLHGLVIDVGDTWPDATVFAAPGEPVTLRDAPEGSKALFIPSLRLLVHLNE